MNETELAKFFILRWAKYTLALGPAEQAALNELKDQGAAHQWVRQLYQRDLSTEEGRKQVAFQLALAEFRDMVSTA